VYALVTSERLSVIFIFDVTNPRRPKFINYATNTPFDLTYLEQIARGTSGDMDPEGLVAANGKVYVSGSVSGTVSTYSFDCK